MHLKDESAQPFQMLPATTSSVSFRYFLSSCSEVVEEDGRIWCCAFPLSRNPQKTATAKPAELTYGDYFTAVRHFLEDRQFQIVVSAIANSAKRPCRACDIVSIDIYLIKHGQFYHPARIEVQACGRIFTFLVNAALSIIGKSGIEREFNLLNRFSQSPSGAYLPKVYGLGGVNLPKERQIQLFLGEWFADFHEFHISLDPVDHQYKIRVWHADAAPEFLTAAETLELYRQIAVILTGCYDPESFNQVFPWHHAAGDFIVRRSGDLLQVKLITVRQYGALLETPDRDETTLMQALLFFLINLSIRTRLDRLDGVGDVVWAGLPAVTGTIRGFMDGLASKNPRWDVRFKLFIAAVSLSEMTEICETIADSYHPLAPELPAVREHLLTHAAEVLASLSVYSE